MARWSLCSESIFIPNYYMHSKRLDLELVHGSWKAYPYVYMLTLCANEQYV